MDKFPETFSEQPAYVVAVCAVNKAVDFNTSSQIILGDANTFQEIGSVVLNWMEKRLKGYKDIDITVIPTAFNKTGSNVSVYVVVSSSNKPNLTIAIMIYKYAYEATVFDNPIISIKQKGRKMECADIIYTLTCDLYHHYPHSFFGPHKEESHKCNCGHCDNDTPTTIPVPNKQVLHELAKKLCNNQTKEEAKNVITEAVKELSEKAAKSSYVPAPRISVVDKETELKYSEDITTHEPIDWKIKKVNKHD